MSGHLLAKSMALILLASNGILVAERQRDWQTGKLLDTDRSRYFAGTLTPAGPNGPGQFGYPIYRGAQDYVIDAGTYVYVAEERVRPRSKPVNLVVNAPVKYAIEKRKLYVIENDGKEHEAQIVKQILKQAPITPPHYSQDCGGCGPLACGWCNKTKGARLSLYDVQARPFPHW